MPCDDIFDFGAVTEVELLFWLELNNAAMS